MTEPSEIEALIGEFEAGMIPSTRLIAALREAQDDIIGTRSANAKMKAELARLQEALEGMVAEWEKMTRYGSPLAKAANENLIRARAALTGSKGG